jgi:hypothetical protein
MAVHLGALPLMAGQIGVATDGMLQKSAASQKVFCILWANGATDWKMVWVTLVALDELYDVSTTFPFWTLTPFAQKGNFLHLPLPGS